jgi:hypothetical protein
MSPYGRRWDKAKKKMAIEAAEARWYREMFSWSIAGDGDEKIAKRLNCLSVPTRRQGKVTRSGRFTGKGWTTSHVRKLLTDPSVHGEGKIQVKSGDTFTFPMPPVVDQETFKLALRARKARRNFGQQTTNREYIISPRKGKCTECGLGFRLESRSYRVKKIMSDGQAKVYRRKTLAPGLVCRGMYVYPHIHRCRKSRHIDFDRVQTVILRKLGEALGTDDFALLCAMPDTGEVDILANRVRDAKDSLDQTTQEVSFVVTEGRTGSIPKPVYDTQMRQLNQVLEYRQERLKQFETEYQNAKINAKKLEKVLPTMKLLKEFWNIFTDVTVNSNNLEKEEGMVALPVENSGIEHLRAMLDIFVESFSVDGDNNIEVKLNIPIIESISKDALSCRQLTNIPSP